MSNTIIKIENVSKLYQLGSVGTQSLQGDFKRWLANIRGKDDPFKQIGVTNKLDSNIGNGSVWALKDINLEIEKGDVIGIIGKNGAGKSTLLKILSRVTTPTTGKITIKGRIASLLEVGTGFHPELTGKENVFLNGSILGMSKSEIKSKFDEIVDFSGIEKYIDTPVKRYSSGMYVRLAFGVAAHLEPEILIVDEVLAVGDAEFQKKALGKMHDISKGQGRTVIFVSHNIDAIKQICKNALLIKEGMIVANGDSKSIADQYLSGFSQKYHNFIPELSYSELNNEFVSLHSIDLLNENAYPSTTFYIDKKIGIRIKLQINTPETTNINIDIMSVDGKYVISSISTKPLLDGNGIYETTVWIKENILNDITYTIGVGVISFNNSNQLQLNNTIYYYHNKIVQFKVDDSLQSSTRLYYKGIYGSLIRPELDWTIQKV